jgi:hypothetical protein
MFCPRCGKDLNVQGMNFCYNCGLGLAEMVGGTPAIDPLKKPAPLTMLDEPTYKGRRSKGSGQRKDEYCCGACGATIEFGDATCSRCGDVLEYEEPETEGQLPDTCYYCGSNPAVVQATSFHTMYNIAERTKLWLGYKYSSKMVLIPRCGSCAEKHDRFSTRWHLGIFAVCSITLLVLFYGMAGATFGWAGGSLLLAFLATFLSYSLFEKYFFKRHHRIRRESDVEEYPLIADMITQGWLSNRPDPANATAVEEAIDRRSGSANKP